MQKFIATFPAGAYPIVAKQLKQFELNELQIMSHDQSAVIFESSLTKERLIELRYFTNIYVVDDPRGTSKPFLNGDFYRLGGMKNGVPTALDSAERAQIERYLQGSGLQSNTHAAKNNFYLIRRTDGQEFLTLKLSRAKFKREPRPEGELRPELAHLMCLAAGLKAGHHLLDPFAGFGAIPYEAARGFGCRQVIASDHHQLARRHVHPQITWHTSDATRLEFLADASIDRIITDPPWGHYEDGVHLPSLYEMFLKEASRVLKPGGVMVLLGTEQLAEVLKAQTTLTCISSWPLLVSGQKATLFKLRKT